MAARMIRRCTDADLAAIDAIINEAALAYRGQRHQFRLAAPGETQRLLQTYWNVPSRRREESVVLVYGKPGTTRR